MAKKETLEELGARRMALQAELDELTPKLQAAMKAERAKGATQDVIAKQSGYSIQQVRNITAGIAVKA
jgi:uncharacterized membrane protein